MVDRLKDADTAEGRDVAIAQGLDDFRIEFLERLVDVIADVGSLRTLFKWVIATFSTATLAAMGVLVAVLT